jgi:hypothetical protein
MQAHLDQIQPTPVEWERFLQSRSSLSGEDIPDPQDEGLEAAVSRLTNWALDNRFPELIMSPARWEDRVVKWMPDNDIDAYLQETINLLPHPPSMQQAQGLLPLLSNIWNTTPQPDRGGLTANELLRVSRIRRR